MLYVRSEICVSWFRKQNKFLSPELQITSSWQLYRRFVSGIMYTLFVVITILVAICYCIAIYGKPAFKQPFRAAGYQAYYYLLGSKGILDDYAYAKNNKTRKYIYIYMYVFKWSLWYVIYRICWQRQFITKLAVIFLQEIGASLYVMCTLLVSSTVLEYGDVRIKPLLLLTCSMHNLRENRHCPSLK
jgi:hypothetical protein